MHPPFRAHAERRILSPTQTEIPLPAASSGAVVRPVPADWPDSPAPQRATRRVPLRWPLVLAAVALLAMVAGGYFGFNKLLSTAPTRDIQVYTVAPKSFPVILEEKGELKAANSIEIRSELEGKSTIIFLIEEGSHVKKGELLVELASDIIDSNIRDAEIKEATARAAFEAARKEQEILLDENASKIRKADLALQMAKIALEKYQEGDAVELRQGATLGLEKAKSVLQRAEDDFKDAKDLYDQGFVTRIELENYRFKSYEAKLELKKAELGLHVLEKYTIPMNMQQKQSDVTEASKEMVRTNKSTAAAEAKAAADLAGKKSEMDLMQEKLAKLKDQKAKAKITAPADGLVVYTRESWWRSESQIQKGASVYERQSLIELPDTTSMKVVIRVHEAQTEHLKVGLPATVDIESFSGRQYRGTVSKIAVLADSQNRWLNPNLKEYETDILLDGSFDDLKPGITAHVEVQIAELHNVLAVPVQAVFGKGGKYFVFQEEDGQVQPVEVQVGLASNEYVEIKKGLTADKLVRLAVTDDMKLMLPDIENTDTSKPRKPAVPKPPAGKPANGKPTSQPHGKK